MAKPLTSWLVPSFSQHNLRLVVSERCLHVSVTKVWHKFAASRERQVSKLLYRRVFDKISTEFRGILRVFVNFAGFRGFNWISRLRDRAKYQKPCSLESAECYHYTWRYLYTRKNLSNPNSCSSISLDSSSLWNKLSSSSCRFLSRSSFLAESSSSSSSSPKIKGFKTMA